MTTIHKKEKELTQEDINELNDTANYNNRNNNYQKMISLKIGIICLLMSIHFV